MFFLSCFLLLLGSHSPPAWVVLSSCVVSVCLCVVLCVLLSVFFIFSVHVFCRVPCDSPMTAVDLSRLVLCHHAAKHLVFSRPESTRLSVTMPRSMSCSNTRQSCCIPTRAIYGFSCAKKSARGTNTVGSVSSVVLFFVRGAPQMYGLLVTLALLCFANYGNTPKRVRTDILKVAQGEGAEPQGRRRDICTGGAICWPVAPLIANGCRRGARGGLLGMGVRRGGGEKNGTRFSTSRHVVGWSFGSASTMA